MTKEDQKKYPFVITLPRHPDHPIGKKHGDPRKSWLYEGIASGSWKVEATGDAWWNSKFFDAREFMYCFQKEQDATIFSLRWK